MKTQEWTPNLRQIGRGASKEIQSVLAGAEEAGGWTGRRLRSGHLMLRHENGGVAVLPSTPSDPRAAKNAAADLRREAAL